MEKKRSRSFSKLNETVWLTLLSSICLCDKVRTALIDSARSWIHHEVQWLELCSNYVNRAHHTRPTSVWTMSRWRCCDPPVWYVAIESHMELVGGNTAIDRPGVGRRNLELGCQRKSAKVGVLEWSSACSAVLGQMRPVSRLFSGFVKDCMLEQLNWINFMMLTKFL